MSNTRACRIYIFNFIRCSIEQQPHKKTTKNNQIILASLGHVYPTND